MQLQAHNIVVIFQSTADALMAEARCQEADIAGRLIPAPRHLSHGCGLAWCCAAHLKDQLQQTLNTADIVGDIHPF